MREHSIPWSKKKTRGKETDIPELVMITDSAAHIVLHGTLNPLPLYSQP